MKKAWGRIISLWRMLIRFLKIKIKWGAPKKAKIAIYDTTNIDYLIPLCGGEDYVEIDTSEKYVRLAPGILFSMSKWTLQTRDPFTSYYLALIEHINPSIVITFIDNSGRFHRVSKHYKHSRFLAIQNAVRDEQNTTERDNVYLPEFACFGNYEIDLYRKKKAIVQRFYPIGSLRDAYYREKFGREPARIDYDVCVVAEASPGWDKAYPGFEDAIGTIAKYALEFCRKHNQKLCIAGKRDHHPKGEGAYLTLRNTEVEWYEKYVGREIKVTPRVRENFTTYGLIDRSSVSIAMISTALREGMGRGKKVLFCNFTGNALWDFPVKGIWFLEKASYEAFEARLLDLLAMTDQEFRTLSHGAAKYVMNYNEDMPTHRFLQELIAGAVHREDVGVHDAR